MGLLNVYNGIDEIAGHWIGFHPKFIRKAQESGLEVGLGFINNKLELSYCKKNSVKRLYTDKILKLKKLTNKLA